MILQEFYKDTLSSRFIKSLLNQTPIPVFQSVVEGDHLIEGCYYVYKNFIIKCASSGILYVPETEKSTLYPSETLYPSVFLYPLTGLKAATFYVRSLVDSLDIKTNSTFCSTTSYYDSETHYHLGRYLRFLYTSTGLNLFPFYNCYNSTYFEGIDLVLGEDKLVHVETTSITKYKTVAVPILFGKTYHVFVDCPTPVLIRAVLHNQKGYIEETVDNMTVETIETLSRSGKSLSRMSFRDPVKFRLESGDKSTILLQNSLYMIIQLPLNNTSSIVVLENYDEFKGVSCDKDSVQKSRVINPLLIAYNMNKSFAYTGRLVEYMVGNIIHSYDRIPQNISKVQTVLSRVVPSYGRALLKREKRAGVWDSDISRNILSIVEQASENEILYDQDGNINKDVETILQSKGGNY